jgi:hypothetical protein
VLLQVLSVFHILDGYNYFPVSSRNVCPDVELIPFNSPTPPLPTRLTTAILPPSDKTPSFLINGASKSYKHQYANIYFMRLRILRDFVEKRAGERWKGVAGEDCRFTN